MEKKDLAYTLAENMVRVNFDDLSAQDVEITKRCILDTIGVILAATTLYPCAKGIIELVKEAEGKKGSSILGFGGKVPAWMAAFANGSLAHALDYDDINQRANMHQSITTLPAAMAVSERVGKVTGKEFMTAITLGNDLACRIDLSITFRPSGWKLDWLTSTILGYFSAAATAGRLLGFDIEKMVDALGIALQQSAGTMELAFSLGSTVRGMYAGFSSQGGVLSALLTQKGVCSGKNVFEGKAGFYNVYLQGEFDRTSLISDLGKTFEGTCTGFKAWPSCAGTHPFIDATLGLVNEYDIKSQQVEEIQVAVCDFYEKLCTPLEGRRRPQTVMDAKFSIPFCVASAATKRRVGLNTFTPEGLKDPDVLEMAQKVIPRPDTESSFAHGAAPAVVEIRTRGGKVFSRKVDRYYGTFENPMSKEDLVSKFNDCVSYSVRPLSKRTIQTVIEMIDNLEELDDVSRLIELVA